MRRSQLGAGPKSLERGSTFASRGQGLKRQHPDAPRGASSAWRPGWGRREVIDRQASEAWSKGVRGKPCIRCAARGCQGHHILTKQALRKRATELGIDAQSILWDKRNRLPLCPRCHAAHHAHAKRVTRATLERYAPKAGQFARELGLEWLLDREYPATPAERAA